MKLTYKHTLFAACASYIVQAIVNNLSPLLFVTFRESLGISLAEISLLITLNFVLQIGIDLLSTFFVDKIGYRRSVVIANILATVGLLSMSLLPMLLSNKYAALLIATCFSAVGGGLIEVVVSPIVEAIPGDGKASVMNLLHSFYCWGQAGVILLSTLFFATIGIENWVWLPMLWAIVPLFTTVLFLIVPIYSLTTEGGVGSSLSYLFKSKIFWIFLFVMICAGASELAMGQWASLFVERGLGVSKTVGDLVGPCLFALCMGGGRVLFCKLGEKIDLGFFIGVSFALAAVAYFLTALSHLPVFSLCGCALCGFSVALLWPGTYSLGAKKLPLGGTAMFTLFALGGDLGCSLGPALVGLISDATDAGRFSFLSSLVGASGEIGIGTGMLIASLFPILASLVVFLWLARTTKNK